MAESNKEEKRTSMKSIHAGHRERMKKRFLTQGSEGLEPHQLLEILLYYGIPQGDTNPLAHNLLNTFGSFSRVMDAPIEQLKNVKGVGPSTAVLLKLIPHLSRFYMMDLSDKATRLYDTEAIGRYFLPKFMGRQKEVVYLLLLDSKGRVLYCELLNEGSITEVPLYTTQIVHLAVQYHAVVAILAHNHPSGETMVSQGDLHATVTLYHALESVGIHLQDHFIVVDGDFLSMKETGLMKIVRDRVSS